MKLDKNDFIKKLDKLLDKYLDKYVNNKLSRIEFDAIKEFHVDILIDAEEMPETNNKNNLLLELKNKIKEVKANEYENICVSLNTAKKLIEVGIEVESHFCWNSLPYMEQNDLKYTIKQFPAPTFEELDPIDHIEKDGKMYILRITKAVNHWLINYVNLRNPKDCLINRDNHHFTNEHSLCETMAEVMIQLKKEGLI